MTASCADSLCVIPARGGSKRIPKKNIRLFAGKPLIARAIATALESGCFARVVVSTDDEQIAETAREHGAETPFLRNAELADDHTTTASVIEDAIRRTGYSGEFACCLYPTAPLLRPADLADSLRALQESTASSLLAVTEYDFPPLRALVLANDGTVEFRFPDYALTRHQDLPRLVHDAGSFYWFRTSAFLQSGKLVSADTLAYEMDRLRCVDIDTEEDWRLAEQLFAFHVTSHGGD